jgi:predicted permease
MAAIVADVRYALRGLRLNPGFAAAAVATLALGIGANTAVFSLMDALLLRPLAVRRPEELVLFGKARNRGIISGVAEHYDVFSYAQYEYFRDNNRFFPGGVAGFASWQSPVRVRRGEASEVARGKLVTGNYFAVAGVAPALGRVLTSADDRPAAAPVAVLSDHYWRSAFQADPSVVSRAVRVNSTLFTIVGVAAPGFFGETIEPDPPDLWFPVARFTEVTLNVNLLERPNLRFLYLMGRAAPGPDLTATTAGLTEQLRHWLADNEPRRDQADVRAAIGRAVIEASPGGTGISHLRRRYSEPLRILLVLAALVLAIACANIAGLLLARGTARESEIFIRQALGASQGRLLSQLLTESLVLSFAGGLLGVLLASWATRALLVMLFRGASTSALDVAPDPRLLAFTAGISMLAGVAFGIVPGLTSSRQSVAERLKGGSRGLVARGQAGFAGGRLLVSGQVALSLLLLLGAGLFGRSLVRLTRQELGFTAERLLLVQVDPRIGGYPYEKLAPLYRRIQTALDALPGVSRSAFALYTPLSERNWSSDVAVSGLSPEQNKNRNAAWVSVTPGYFETMGIPLRTGRSLAPEDTGRPPRIAVVNEAFVRGILGGENPLGRRFGFDDEHRADWEIVGVVGDAKHTDPREPAEPTFYLPVTEARPEAQVLVRSSYLPDLVVRTSGDSAAVASAVRQTLRALDPDLPVTGITTMREQVGASLRQEQLISVLSGVFAALALLLACLGLYGRLAYAVGRRTREIGLRMALGADRRTVVWIVVRETLVLVGLGVAIGLPAAIAGARWVRGQLFGIQPLDPPTLLAATLVLGAVAVLSGYVPARRAAAVDPMVALRTE